jgi:CRP/FNR family transcriptional regulator, cyclic AMP receptor protein
MGLFKSLFSRSDAGAESASALSIANSESAQQAAALLRAPTALMRLTQEEASIVVRYMRPGMIPESTTFIREGDADDNDFMMLVLQGEVMVETQTPPRQALTTLKVLGPGSLIGEMALLDGEPRSATCTASTSLMFAQLTRTDFEQLLRDDPQTGCKLLLAISYRIAERMRDTTEKLKVSMQLITTLQQEIDRLMPT